MKLITSVFFFFVVSTYFFSITSNNDSIEIGWASADITPKQPFLLSGQFHARIAEGVLDPITATVLLIKSTTSDEIAVLISCDLSLIEDGVRNNRTEDNF